MGALVIGSSCDLIKNKALNEYKKKTHESEAKIQLVAAYTALQSFHLDFGFYAGCLKYMGYDPSSQAASRRYAIGIKKIEIDPSFAKEKLPELKENLGLNEDCINKPVHFFENGKLEDQTYSYRKVTLDDFPDDAKVYVKQDGSSGFKIYAIAIGVDGYKSIWSIDQDRKLEKHDDTP